MPRLAILAAALLAVAASCGAVGLPLGADQAALVDQFPLVWKQIQEAPYTTRYRGERRIEFSAPGAESDRVVRYVEEVTCDGLGRFGIEPLYVETEVHPDPATFLLLQGARQGFFFRYRDFAVRDADLVLENFELSGGLEEVLVAGRTCLQARLVRKQAGGHHYEVAFDLLTGLPLRCVEYDEDARRTYGMEFLTVDFAPELGQVAFHVPRNSEEPLVEGAERESLGFEPVRPLILPAGYRASSASKVEDDLGRRWFKLEITDGIEVLFFLCRSRAGMPSLPTTLRSSVRDRDTGEVMVFQSGPVTVAQGVVGDWEFIAVGDAPAEPLLRMIDSALD